MRADAWQQPPLVRVVDAFREAYGREPEGVWAAPGRVNLIGEHTDYNDGLVLPIALEQRALVAAARSPYGRTHAISVQFPTDVTTFNATTVVPGQISGWGAYLAGVGWALRIAGHAIDGLDLVVDSDIPIGAGLSSSHALECAAGLAWMDLAGLPVDRMELALACRQAENDFVGAPTGIMDQTASLYGRDGHAVFVDTRTLAVEHVPLELAGHGLALLVVDTRAPHRHADGEYAARRQDCEEAAGLLGARALRDVELADLDALPPHLRRRAGHVVTENARVRRVVSLLGAGSDPRSIGPVLTASHVSLRDDFEVSAPEVDTAVDALLEAGAYGARITGGGFGGCVIALVEDAAVVASVTAVEATYAGRGFAPPSAFVAVPSAGARRLDV